MGAQLPFAAPPAEDFPMKSILAFASASIVAITASAAFAMGPDPGGHTGATVTPETTKTDRPAVDAARQNSSGSNTEASGPAAEPSSKQARKK